MSEHNADSIEQHVEQMTEPAAKLAYRDLLGGMRNPERFDASLESFESVSDVRRFREALEDRGIDESLCGRVDDVDDSNGIVSRLKKIVEVA